MQYSKIETVEKMEDLMPLIRESLVRNQSVRFMPHGISMRPMIRQGLDSVVITQLPEKLEKYDLLLYQRDDGKYILHRIVGVGKTYTCIGDNQFKEEHGVRRDQMIALVTGFYRNQKYHSVTEPGYQIYCRFWHCSRPIRHFFRRMIGWLRRKLR